MPIANGNPPNQNRMNRSHSTDLSPAGAAKILGVSISTVKRWVDEGVIPARLSPGGHRKLSLVDVKRLSRSGTLPPVDPSGSPPESIGELAKAFDRTVRANDVDAIGDLISAAAARAHPVQQLADEVIAPALARLGSDWAAGRATVAREHRITQAVIAAVHRLNGELGTTLETGRPVALGCAPAFDHYVLPSLLAKMTLVEAGWNAVDLGPNTPFAALLAAADEFEPKLIWLSVSHLADAERFAAEYLQFYRVTEDRGIALVLGGQAMTTELRSRLRCTTFGEKLAHLATFARILHPARRTPKRGRPVGGGKK